MAPNKTNAHVPTRLKCYFLIGFLYLKGRLRMPYLFIYLKYVKYFLACECLANCNFLILFGTFFFYCFFSSAVTPCAKELLVQTSIRLEIQERVVAQKTKQSSERGRGLEREGASPLLSLSRSSCKASTQASIAATHSMINSISGDCFHLTTVSSFFDRTEAPSCNKAFNLRKGK